MRIYSKICTSIKWCMYMSDKSPEERSCVVTKAIPSNSIIVLGYSYVLSIKEDTDDEGEYMEFFLLDLRVKVYSSFSKWVVVSWNGEPYICMSIYLKYNDYITT